MAEPDVSQLTDEQRKELEEKLKNMSPEEIAELQKQQCIFCQILTGKVPSKKIYEDDICTAVLDINPAVKGHLLLLPKEHYAIMPQVPEKEISHMFVVARVLSHAFLKVLGATGSNIFIANGVPAGQRAQHFMIHLIPRREDDNVLNFEEKLHTEAQKKVKVAIENKLNEVLGVSKEVVHLEEAQKEGQIDVEPAGEEPLTSEVPEAKETPETEQPEEEQEEKEEDEKEEDPADESPRESEDDHPKDDDSEADEKEDDKPDEIKRGNQAWMT
jgi:histidine triad (HIT) family protein